MFCPNCGAEAEGGKFCAVCGSPLPIMPESAVRENPSGTPAPAPLPWEAPAEPGAQSYQAPQYTAPQYTESQYQNAQYGPGYQYMEPQYTAPQPAGPEKMPEAGKKKVNPLPFILIGGGVLLAGLAVLFILLFAKSPTGKVAAAAAKSMAAVKKTEAGKVADELKKSEVKVSVDLESVLPYYMNYDGTVNVTFSDDMDAGKIFLELSLALKGKELADVGIYMDEKALAVKSDTLLGDDAYGVTFGTLPADLKESIFAPNSGTPYALTKDVYNMLCQLDQSPIALYKEASGSLEELYKEGGQKLLDSLKAHAKISQENGTISVGGSKAECTVVKAEADEEATKAILEDMAAWLKEEGTRKKLERFYNVVVKIQSIAEGGRSSQDAEDLLEDFYDELDDSLEDIEAGESTIRFYINKKNGQLIGFSAETEDDDDESSLEIVAGPDFEDPAEIRVVVENGGSRQEFTYEVTQNSDSTYAAEISVAYGRSTAETYEFEWKKKRSSFTLSADGRELYSGTLKIEDDTVLLEIDDTGVAIEMTKGAKTPDVPKFNKILELSKDEFEDLLYDIEDEIQNIMRKMQ